MRLIIAVILVLIFFQAFSQNQKQIDSVQNCLTLAKQDTTRIRLLIKLASIYYSLDLKKGEEYGDKALALSEKINSKRHIAESLHKLADIYYYQGKIDKSKKTYNEALKIFRILNDRKKIAGCYNDIGYVLREEGKYADAIDHYQSSLKTYEALNDIKGIARATLNIGVIFSDQNNNAKAIEYQEKVLELYKKIGDAASIANTYARLGNSYSSLKKSAVAIEYYNKSLELFKSVNHKRGIAVIYNNLAIMYNDMGENIKARDYYLDTLELQFAGANNPLYIVETGESPVSTIRELRPDKMPVGIHHQNESMPFTNNRIQLKKGDTVYVFSDGFFDQFGGSKGKKFSPNKFRELLFGFRDYPLDEQKKLLNTILDGWKDDIDQVDDILVVGVKI
ncbi:MAG: tetratricopeptide repeat protein [Bacteroidia bacterium]|nr:tetratricopeptide repeat protein [Bacteroidia bacterium]